KDCRPRLGSGGRGSRLSRWGLPGKRRTDKAMSFADVSLQASVAWNLPEGMEPSLEAQAFYDPDNFVYPFGAHACVVEIDSETGEIEIKRYLAVDDPGPVINPMV